MALQTVRDHPEPLASHGGYHVFVGTAHSPAQLRFGHDASHNRSSDPAIPVLGRLHLRNPIGPVAIGDRFVLRDEGTNRTVAGGAILAIDGETRRYAETQLAARWRTLADTSRQPNERAGRLAATLVEQAGGIMEGEALEREVGPLDEVVGEQIERVGPHVVHAGLASRRRDAILTAVRSFDAMAEPHDPLGRIVADRLVADGRIERLSGTLRPAGRGSDERRQAIQRMTEVLDAAEPPLLTPEDLRSEIGAATHHRSAGIRAGAMVEVGPFLTTPARFAQLAVAVEEAIGDGCTTVSAIRSRLGLSRKYVLPLLETLDHQGRTVRHGDERAWAAPPPA